MPSTSAEQNEFRARLADLDSGEEVFLFPSAYECNLAIDSLIPDGSILCVTNPFSVAYSRFVATLGSQSIERVVRVDSLDAAMEALDASIVAIWTESIQFPWGVATDLRQFRTIAANRLLIVDNSYATTALCRPGAFGADIVAYFSLAPFIGSHVHVGAAITACTVEVACRLPESPFAGLGLPKHTVRAALSAADTLSERVSRRVSTCDELRRALKSCGIRIWAQYAAGNPTYLLPFEAPSDSQRATVRNGPPGETIGLDQTSVARVMDLTHAPGGEAEAALAGVSQRLLLLSVGLEPAAEIARQLGI